jgi:hypothetical protein
VAIVRIDEVRVGLPRFRHDLRETVTRRLLTTHRSPLLVPFSLKLGALYGRDVVDYTDIHLVETNQLKGLPPISFAHT